MAAVLGRMANAALVLLTAFAAQHEDVDAIILPLRYATRDGGP
jgi:hypothetical protein